MFLLAIVVVFALVIAHQFSWLAVWGIVFWISLGLFVATLVLMVIGFVIQGAIALFKKILA